MAELFSMGGYGGFIWLSWGIALVVLTILIGTSLKSMRNRERKLAQMGAEARRRRHRRAVKIETADTPSITDKPERDQ